ncbi:MAG: hypothetical protein ACT4OZ_07885 [Gemmatimonadota bacterium]
MSRYPVLGSSEEPTLGAVLRGFAADQLPTRFHQFLQLGIPAAVQFAIWGAWPAAGLSLSLSAFGVWALCEQRLTAADDQMQLVPVGERSRRLLTAARALSGAAAGGGAAVLLVLAIVKVLGIVFRCPGCAG